MVLKFRSNFLGYFVNKYEFNINNIKVNLGKLKFDKNIQLNSDHNKISIFKYLTKLFVAKFKVDIDNITFYFQFYKNW